MLARETGDEFIQRARVGQNKIDVFFEFRDTRGASGEQIKRGNIEMRVLPD